MQNYKVDICQLHPLIGRRIKKKKHTCDWHDDRCILDALLWALLES